MDLRFHGDAAVVTGRNIDKATYKGKDISGEVRFTDVFVNRDGKWQAASTQLTRVVPPMQPSSLVDSS